MIPAILCSGCGAPTPKLSPTQKWCSACAVKAHIKTRNVWRKANTPREVVAARIKRRAQQITQQGREINDATMTHLGDRDRELVPAWIVRVAVPFDSKASKNALYRMRGPGNIRLREEVKSYRDLIGYRVKEAMANQPVKHNKLWLDIFIQKDTNRCDAVNFVDTICDAIKRVIPLDDRWYAIQRLDWEIVKEKPRIIISLMQEEGVEDAKVCVSCGRIVPLTGFYKSRTERNGVSANCKACRERRTDGALA